MRSPAMRASVLDSLLRPTSRGTWATPTTIYCPRNKPNRLVSRHLIPPEIRYATITSVVPAPGLPWSDLFLQQSHHGAHVDSDNTPTILWMSSS